MNAISEIVKLILPLSSMAGKTMLPTTYDKTYKKYMCVIATIVLIILAGILIYLSIYLTNYTSHSTTTLSSFTNATNVTHSMHVVTKKQVETTPISTEDDTLVYPVSSPIPVFPNFTSVSLTTVPLKPIKQMVMIPDVIRLTNVTPTI